MASQRERKTAEGTDEKRSRVRWDGHAQKWRCAEVSPAAGLAAPRSQPAWWGAGWLPPEASDEHRTEMEMLTIGEAEDSHLERGAQHLKVGYPKHRRENFRQGRGVKDAEWRQEAKKREKTASVVNKLSQRAEVAVFSTLKSYISLPVQQLTVSWSPAAPRRLLRSLKAHDCLSETLHDYRATYSRYIKEQRWKDIPNVKITAAEQSDHRRITPSPTHFHLPTIMASVIFFAKSLERWRCDMLVFLQTSLDWLFQIYFLKFISRRFLALVWSQPAAF